MAKENTIEGLKEAMNNASNLDSSILLENIKKIKKEYNWENQEKILLEQIKDIVSVGLS